MKKLVLVLIANPSSQAQARAVIAKSGVSNNTDLMVFVWPLPCFPGRT